MAEGNSEIIGTFIKQFVRGEKNLLLAGSLNHGPVRNIRPKLSN